MKKWEDHSTSVKAKREHYGCLELNEKNLFDQGNFLV